MKKSNQSWSRRKFLTAATIAGAGAAMMNPMGAWAQVPLDPRVAKIVADTMGIDTHNHIDIPLITDQKLPPDLRISDEMKRSGLSAICMTFALDYQKLGEPGEVYNRFLVVMASMDYQLKQDHMKRSLNYADLRMAHKEQVPTVVQSVEGCHFLEGHIERLKTAYDRGLRHLGLLHDSDAAVPLGDVFTNPPRWGGLTTFGADVIHECNRLGILVDLSHASNETLDAAIKVSKQPVIISHTGLDTQLGENARMARMMLPRLISREQAKIVADAGGVIGVWTHLSASALEYARNIRAMVDVAGIDHVCIGTDTKLTPGYRSGNNEAKPGAQKNEPRIGERTNSAWQNQQEGFYYTVVDAMLKTGFSDDEIGKIGSGNFCRIFDAATVGNT